MGKNSLGIEMEIAWANPAEFTIHNFPCYEDGSNCVSTAQYVDPSVNVEQFRKRRLANNGGGATSLRG